MIRRTVRKAFTLVEILIVVVILGILAAIVVPQFTRATEDAQAGNLKAQLSSLNRQIELYRARHSGQIPTVDATFWTTLVTDGYIKNAPSNPAYSGTGSATGIVSSNAGGDADNGWVISDATGSGTVGAADYIPPYTLFASYFDEITGTITPGTP